MNVRFWIELLFLTIWLLIFAESTFAQPKQSLRVVLIAGPNDHCDQHSACHRYIEDMEIVRDCLLQQAGIDVDLLIAERPKIGSLDDADVIVVHAASDDTESEWNALFPRLNQKKLYKKQEYRAFLDYIDRRMDEGMGFIALHYATSVNHKESIRRYKKWMGGHFNDATSKSDGDETNPETFVAMEAVKLKSPDHPILRGVNKWESEAEYYYQLELLDEVIPILTSDLPINDPKEEIIAWAYDRPEGGRGFGFTGGHNHNNMYLEDFRKFLLNAVFWTGNLEVPKAGVQSELTKRYIK